MQNYSPWDDSWKDQVIFIMTPFASEAPVEMPSTFTYPVFLTAFQKKVKQKEFWQSVAGAMVYVLGHCPAHPQALSYIYWLNKYNNKIKEELIYDGTNQVLKGNLVTAVWLLQAAVLLNPEQAEVHYNLALVYYQLGLSLKEDEEITQKKSCLKQAEQYLQNAAILEPEGNLINSYLNNIYQELGMHDEEYYTIK